LAAAPAPQLTLISVEPFQPNSGGVTSDAEQRYYELRIFTFDESTNEFVESESQEERINLNDERLKAIAPFDPSRLPELFKRLPSDRYRIYLIEDDTERLMIEFVIEQVGDEGHPVELPETIDVEDQPAANPEDATLPDEQADPAAVLPRLQIESLDRNEPSFAEKLGRASFVSSGGVLFGAAMLSKPARQSREKLADRRMASFRKRMRSRANR
jgi:trimeric autotransporter adhesin